MKHTKRRKLTVEDFNRALRWSSVEVSGLSHKEPGGMSCLSVQLRAGDMVRHENQTHSNSRSGARYGPKHTLSSQRVERSPRDKEGFLEKVELELALKKF
jgi:hypothetical protein